MKKYIKKKTLQSLYFSLIEVFSISFFISEPSIQQSSQYT